MFYVRERRLWLLVKADGAVRLALSSNRRTLDLDEEFAVHRDALTDRLTRR